VTGPDLDDIGEVSEDRVLSAIENGGTGSGRMPAGLLSEGDAEAVALYVSRVAGR
jgi:mono/diheme cytochrome c family protein